jgi:hypothetical protein
MNAVTALVFATLGTLLHTEPSDNDKNAEHVQVWRLEKLSESESANSAQTEVTSLPRFLVITDEMVFDLLFIDKNGGYTSIHRKMVQSRTARDAKETLLISDLKNGEKFALQLYPSKSGSSLRTTLTARKDNSVFARIARCEYRVASDKDSLQKLEEMTKHDRVLDDDELGRIIAAFLIRAKEADEPSDETKSPSCN